MERNRPEKDCFQQTQGNYFLQQGVRRPTHKRRTIATTRPCEKDHLLSQQAHLDDRSSPRVHRHKEHPPHLYHRLDDHSNSRNSSKKYPSRKNCRDSQLTQTCSAKVRPARRYPDDHSNCYRHVNAHPFQYVRHQQRANTQYHNEKHSAQFHLSVADYFNYIQHHENTPRKNWRHDEDPATNWNNECLNSIHQHHRYGNLNNSDDHFEQGNKFRQKDIDYSKDSRHKRCSHQLFGVSIFMEFHIDP